MGDAKSLSHNIGNLLPWDARLIGFNGDKTDFGCCSFHAQISNYI